MSNEEFFIGHLTLDDIIKLNALGQDLHTT
jgi:hypothetical protein